LPYAAPALSQKGFDMTGLMAGYAVAIVAMLIAASAALTIIRNFGRLDASGQEPSREETPTKAAA
jgi:hypothetical protein